LAAASASLKASWLGFSGFVTIFFLLSAEAVAVDDATVAIVGYVVV
jgi:hypothetical protein